MGQTFLWCRSKQTTLHLKLMTLSQPYVPYFYIFSCFWMTQQATVPEYLLICGKFTVQQPNLFGSFQPLAGSCLLSNISHMKHLHDFQNFILTTQAFFHI